jgi:uncharacterized protein (TIGR02217 family)
MAEVGGFHEDAKFPTNISYRSRVGVGFQTFITELDSGAEQRVSRGGQGRRRYNVAYGIRGKEDLQAVRDFWIGRLGNAYGFRYEDPWDKTTAADHTSDPSISDVVLGIGGGGIEQFALKKTYTSGTTVRTRMLRKPVANTTVLSSDLVELTEGVDFTVDTTTGLVTIDTTSYVGQTIRGGCQFDVPCAFRLTGEEALMMSIEDYGVGTSTDIPIIEILGDTIIDDEVPLGGGAEISLTADISITPATGRALGITPNASGHAIILPDHTDLEAGAPYFYLTNTSGSYTFKIQYPAANDIVTVAVDSWAIVILTYESGIKTWSIFTP